MLHSIDKCCAHSEPEFSLCDRVKYVLCHGYVALVVLQEVQLVLDDRRVEALFCQRHLQLFKRCCYLQSVLPKAQTTTAVCLKDNLTLFTPQVEGQTCIRMNRGLA